MNLLFKLFGGSYDNLWKAIIRPHRDEYNIDELGPYKFEFKGKCYKRTDFELINKRSQKMMCSFWEPFDEEREKPRLPCVIYLHGNSSSRCEAYPEVKYLLLKNITVFAFDFCGCGKSEGEYISLGYYEKSDVHCVVEYLLKTKKVSKIGIWGRSMGAVTAIMYANEHPKLIDVMILDSGFYSLKTLISELIKSKVNLPKFIFDKVLDMVKETVKEKAKFDLDIIEPYIYAKNCQVPAFFFHGDNDSFVLPHHCFDLFNEYKGTDKCCEIIKGVHNSSRPKELRTKVNDFLIEHLKDDDLESNGTINNSNSYERADAIYKIFKDIQNNKSTNITNNLSYSYNNIENKPKNARKSVLKIKKQLHSDINKNVNSLNLDEFNITNESNFSVNARENIRTLSQNKRTKTNEDIINKKNTGNNLINRNIKIKIKNLISKNLKNEENKVSSISSTIYKKKNIKKENFNHTKIKSLSTSQYSSNDIKPSINQTKNPLIIHTVNISNFNKNKNTRNYNINKNNTSYSFLNNVIINDPIIRYKKNITIANSFMRRQAYRLNSKNSKSISKGEKTFMDNFLKTTSSNNINNTNDNIIQNNYFTTNNIYFNNDEGGKSKKQDSKYNFSNKTKKPRDKYKFSKNKMDKTINKNEIKKNILFKSLNDKKSKIKNSLNNKNIKDIKKIPKKPINSIENSDALNQNEEITK